MTNEGRWRGVPDAADGARSPVRSSGAQGALAALLIDPLAPVQREVNSRRRFPARSAPRSGPEPRIRTPARLGSALPAAIHARAAPSARPFRPPPAV